MAAWPTRQLIACLVVYGLITSAWGYWSAPPSGFATLTHYGMPLDAIAACGCTGASTHYPTAAISQLAYGSKESYGPSCGACYNITLLNTFLSSPPWYPTRNPSIVVKITDQCPASSAWCEATEDKPNKAGHDINFDLAFPNPAGAIPTDFFPQNTSYYGYADFGVWNVSYNRISCIPNWAGSSDPAAMGSVKQLGSSVCCPGEVDGNSTCPSFSESPRNTPPDTGTTSPAALPHLPRSGQIAIGVIVTAVCLTVLILGGWYIYLCLRHP